MKGQIRVEFIFGIVIFIVVIFLVITQANTLYSSLLGDSRKDALKAKAINVIDILVGDAGDPPNWDLTAIPVDVVLIDDISPSMDGKEAPGGGACKKPCDSFPNPSTSTNNGCTNFNSTHSAHGENVWNEVWPNCSDCDNITHPGTLDPTAYGTIFDRADINESCPINDVKNTDKLFVEQLNETIDRSALIVFDDHASTPIRLTNNTSEVENAIDNGIYIRESSSTQIACGIGNATKLLNDTGNPNSKWVEILITDGLDYPCCTDTHGAAITAAANNITIYTIGYQENESYLNETQLNETASITGGKYYYSPDANSLTSIYLEISQRIKASLKRVGLEVTGSAPSDIKTTKINKLSQNCDFLDVFDLGAYRLKIYNSTRNQILFCGYDSLEPPTVMETRYVYINGDFGMVTLELW